MTQTTTFLQLTKPGGGSTGLNTPPDRVDIDVLNDNFDRIDDAASRALGGNPVIGNCDTVTKPGIYRANSSTLNIPVSTAGGSLTVIPAGTSGSNLRQIFQRVVGGAASAVDRRYWVRESNNTGSTWSNWETFDFMDTGWTNLTLQNGFTSALTPQYKVAGGIAYFRGEIINGTDGLQPFAVPSEAIPAVSRRRFVMSRSSTAFASLLINTDGTTTFGGTVVGASPGYNLAVAAYPVA